MLFDFHCLQSSIACAFDCSLVHIPNGKTSLITHIGTHNLSNDYDLTKVLYVPDFNHNLILVSKLTRDLQCLITFYPNFCFFRKFTMEG